ncbi:MAG: helix-turn-helix domain-containing protein [Deltaproteobacteria bacterium]|jgi:predicted transcriptional regulator|nr:helix-turn-helix domain-containing protein [Deltaproteobacteria bacterium]
MSKEIKNKDIKLLKSLGEKIRNKQVELKISTGNVAEFLNISDTQVYRYESGDSLIPIDNLLKLCELFHVDINYFIGDIKKEKENNFCIANFPSDPELEKRIAVLKEVYALGDESLKFGINNCIDTINAVLKKLKDDRRNPSPVKRKRLAGDSK